MKFWNEDQIQQLTALWAAGESAGLIASRMDMTRGMIIGKVFRLGLPKRHTVVAVGGPVRPKRPSAPPRRDRSIMAFSPLTGTRRPHNVLYVRPPKIEPTKNELRAMLRQAVLNTAASQ